MKIQSKYKDYYDYISHKFGADPNTVYVRNTIPISEKIDLRKLPSWKSDTDYYHRDTNARVFYDSLAGNRDEYDKSGRLTLSYKLQFVVVGDHVIPVVKETKPGWMDADHIVQKESYEKFEPLSSAHSHLLTPKPSRYLVDLRPRMPSLPSSAQLQELIRAVGVPVFRILERDRRDRLHIAEKVPNLSDMNIPSVLPAEAAWQSIYTTLTSVLRIDPDKAPPVVVGEKYRIEAAGFDLKTSFRNPVNPKPKKAVKKAK